MSVRVLLARFVFGIASLIELVLCSFVFEFLCRKQWIQMSRDEVGLFAYKYIRVGFAFQVRAGTCHSTESALSLVVDQIAVYVLFVNWCSTNRVCF